ncbi:MULTISPECIES: ABC transporter permease [Subtercola]|uniref:Iron ABC transporter permease n=1 Tax=Subtercola vilae TaxID=2056433 RepID=A0A4V4RFV0_9MICO|nr:MULTISPECIES: iron ABC transporter permease [Subtercola]MEA9985474.1 iron ABC transporter permease [Subtercola sp. RTI3]TIH39304.1 iron ABC transporter permease [Subtercola vilae]
MAERIQNDRRKVVSRGSRPSALLVVLVCLIAVVMLVPVGYVLSIVLQVGWSTLAPLIFRPKVGELLVNSLLLVGFGVPLCVALGVGGAWLVERTTLPGRRVWGVLLAAPLAIPAFVSSYGWVSAVPSIGGLGGGLLIATLAYFPLVYLPAVATLRGLDPALEESARSLGLGPWAVFFRVVLPQLRLAVWGGGLVVALHLLAEYGAFALIRFDTFTTAIVVQYESTFAGPAASALGAVLATVCLVLLVVEASTRGRARFARLGSGVARRATPARLGAFAPLALVGLALLSVLSIGVPVASLVRWLSVGDPWSQRELPTSIIQTVLLAGGGAVAAVLVALPVAWLSVRHPSRRARVLEGATYVASSLPAIIIALALVTVTIRLVPALYQTPFTVGLAYVIIFLPRALVSLRTGLAQAPVALEEAAEALGHSLVSARLRVTLPLLLPSIGAAAALVGLGAANELTATLLLAPNGTRTLATQFWSASSAVAYSNAAPYAVLLILLSVPAVALLFAQSRKRVTT